MKGPIRKHEDANVQIEFQNLYTNITDLPVGSIILFPITTNVSSRNDLVPNNFLLCNGGSQPKDLYPELYSKMGNMFGIPTAPGSFNVPNIASPGINLAYIIKAR